MRCFLEADRDRGSQFQSGKGKVDGSRIETAEDTRDIDSEGRHRPGNRSIIQRLAA
jgi:hypothetical protein